MLKYKICFLLAVSFSLIGKGQSELSGTVTYKAYHEKTQIKKDKNNSTEKTAGIEGANELLSNASDVYATLNFNSEGSSYRVDNKLKIDGIESINITHFFAGANNLYYHNRDSLYVLQSNTTLGKTFLIKNELPHWIITKETKRIDGILCLKAYSIIKSDAGNTKPSAIAWFSPSIPVNYGPLQYFGLPGLIIELQFSKMTLIAEKINLNKKKVIIEKPKEAPIVTPEEFMDIAKKNTPEFFEK